MAASVRIRILRNSIIKGYGEAKAGEEFEVSPYSAATKCDSWERIQHETQSSLCSNAAERGIKGMVTKLNTSPFLLRDSVQHSRIRKRMSDSSPNNVSHKREPVGSPCRERDRLRNAGQKIRRQLDALGIEKLAAFEANDEARVWRLNRDMERLHAERARTEDALRKHIRIHRCKPL